MTRNKQNHKKLAATNDALWVAEDKMGDVHRVLYRISEVNPDDLALKELEERYYCVWSDFLHYLNDRPMAASERADLEWTAGRARRKVVSRFLGYEVD